MWHEDEAETGYKVYDLLYLSVKEASYIFFGGGVRVGHDLRGVRVPHLRY